MDYFFSKVKVIDDFDMSCLGEWYGFTEFDKEWENWSVFFF